MAEREPVLTRNIRPGQGPLDLAAYERAGGYRALRKAVGRMTPEELRQVVADSGLRGRGGAGFPTGEKWSFVPQGPDAPRPKYLVANGDEMEPGTFKDRLLMAGDPQQLVEAMIVSGYALQMDQGFFFIRPEYPEAADRLQQAIAEARAAGYLGRDILGSGWSFELQVHTSAGRYICGEETALLNALEGRRPHPRSRPPYPAVTGLWGKPTIVQNIETLACVPHIVLNGPLWFRELGRGEDAGTKLYCVSGRVRRPGVYELPLGVSLRELLEESCGGMEEGYRFKAALPGGASTMLLTAGELDTPLDFTSLERVNNRLGTGGVIVVDHRTCVVGLTLNLERFFARESCGWCTPCREGLPWVEGLLREIEEGRGQQGDPELLQRQIRLIGPNSFCAHALGAAGPLTSALEKFRHEFDDHLRMGRCPFRPDTAPAATARSGDGPRAATGA